MRKTEYTLSGPGISMALITDMHERNIGRILRILDERPSDIILITGDMTDSMFSNRLRERTLRNFRAIAQKGKTYFSIGNHEKDLGERELSLISDTGTCVLDNRYVRLRDGVWLGGLSSLTYRNPDSHPRTHFSDFLDRFCELHGYRILMCHHPEYYEWYLKDRQIDLILSGHAHGGQWRFSGRGVYAPGQGMWPKYTKGVYDGRLIVSAGCSNSAPVPRLFNPTEVVFVTAGEQNTLADTQ